ncbi:MAG: ABC transporter ATP-binding protein [Planctomycetes bacterium]|nr:ABC transporter ATP-binding protein [Planctomycetota bacterium]
MKSKMGKLLEAKNLSIALPEDGGQVILTEGISFDIQKGEVYSLVGESGCGKTITALSLLNVLPTANASMLTGEVLFNDQDLLKLPEKDLCKIRGKDIAVIFQEPSSAMNPLMKVRAQLEECYLLHQLEVNHEAIDLMLKEVGFADPERVLNSYPHELSGGMLQRVMIAMALLLKPKLIIADEPTTALDVTIQAQIMDLLDRLRREHDVSILLITHNLNLVAQYSDRVAVMYAGRMVEEAGVEEFFAKPCHPYSKGLLRALPKMGSAVSTLEPIQGQVPLPKNFVPSCRFADRCSQVVESQCCSAPIAFKEVGPQHKVACVLEQK